MSGTLEPRAMWLTALMVLPAIVLGLILWKYRHADVFWWLRSHEIRHATSLPSGHESPDLAAPSLGSHALLGQEHEYAPNPATTTPVDTQQSGSSFVVFNAGSIGNARMPTDTHGNQWTLLGDPVVYHGYDGRFDVKAYTALAGHGGANHAVSIVKDGQPSSELTLLFVEVRNASRLQQVAQTYASKGPSATSDTVVTTGPAVLLAVWWGDGPFKSQWAIPGDGFTTIENFVDLPPNSAVQAVAAVRRVDAAGSYAVTWQQSPEQGAILWLMAFQAEAQDPAGVLGSK